MSSFLTFLTKLRSKHFDLTGRNRLINLRHSPARTLRFLSPNLDAITNKIFSDNDPLEVKPVPEPERNKWEKVNDRIQRPDVKKYAESLGIDTSYESDQENPELLQCLYYPDELETRIRKLDKEGKSAFEEKGLKISYLVIGFLEYPEQQNSEKVFQAPLISIPINISKLGTDKKSGAIRYGLIHNGDELDENLSLREKLKRDFNFSLPKFLEIDSEFKNTTEEISRYLSDISLLIKDKPNWNLKLECSVALLSFAKQVFTSETDESKWTSTGGTRGFEDHEGINLIYEGSSTGGSGDYDSLEDYEIDNHKYENIPLIYDADSSQQSAIIDVLEGKSLVIEGPPGTGKSQTITNLIATLIKENKRILFISDKLAALKVVKKRMENAGLGDFCLELHSSKTKTKDFLEEISQRQKLQITLSERDLDEKISLLETRKSALKQYKELINSVQNNNLGLRTNQIIWKALKHRNNLNEGVAFATKKSISNACEISPPELQALTDKFNAISDARKEYGIVDSTSEFWGFYPKSLSQFEIEAIKPIFQELISISAKINPLFLEVTKIIQRDDGIKISYLDVRTIVDFFNQVSLIETSLTPKMLDILWKQGLDSTTSQRYTLIRLKEEINSIISLQEFFIDILKEGKGIGENEFSMAENMRNFSRQELLESFTLTRIKSELTAYKKALDLFLINLKNFNDYLDSRELQNIITKSDLEIFKELYSLLKLLPAESLEFVGNINVDLKYESDLKLFKLKQKNCNHIQNELDEHIYLDALPTEDNLKEILTTLREGKPFFSLFNGKWRKAKKGFKSLSKKKTNCSVTKMENLIERCIEFNRLNNELNNIISIKELMGLKFEGKNSNVSAYLDLIDFNKKIEASDNKTKIQKIANHLNPISIKNVLINESKFDELVISNSDLYNANKFFFAKSNSLSSVQKTEILSNQLNSIEGYIVKIESLLNFADEYVSKEDISITNALRAISAKFTYEKSINKLNKNKEYQELFQEFFAGIHTDTEQLSNTLGIIDKAIRLDTNTPNSIISDLISQEKILKELCINIRKSHLDIILQTDALSSYGKFHLHEWAVSEENFYGNLIDKTNHAIDKIQKLIPWSVYCFYRDEIINLGYPEFIQDVESNKVLFDRITDLFLWNLYTTISNVIYENNELIKSFSVLNHSRIRREFISLDKEIIKLYGKKIALISKENCTIPEGQSSPVVYNRTNMNLLKYLLPQTRPRITIRRIMNQAFEAVLALKPCFMMSPIAVAQYLPKMLETFDFVIMDEASQIRLEESFGSIARSKKLVVVGDPKQLPPTDFFDTNNSNDNEEIDTSDADSILDACIGNFKQIRRLKWHYRSRHESLISFSNHNFYKNELIVFPSPYPMDIGLGVKNNYIADAIYEAQMNVKEAQAVVDAAVTQILSFPDDSLGIVSLNLKQKELIEELFYNRTKDNKAINKYLEKWESANEDFFVKNLENVQGDERDFIFISTTFGKGQGMTHPRQNFGPISRENGWKRLNVLFTRARKSISLFTSMEPNEIIDDVSTPRGTKMLRAYLEFAKTGILEVYKDTGGSYESEFEEAVGSMLVNAGYKIKSQLGVSKFRIDIAVEHPDYPSSFLAAIECDGASYHSDRSVRDRDRIRQEILENLGWQDRIWRIWSVDWYRSPEIEFGRLTKFLEEVRSLPVVKSNPRKEILKVADNETEDLFGIIEDASNLESVFEDRVEIEAGDIVSYFLTKDNLEKTVKIIEGPSVIQHGIISVTTPLAQALLGASVGDEVILRIAGNANKEIIIKKIVKSNNSNLDENVRKDLQNQQ